MTDMAKAGVAGTGFVTGGGIEGARASPRRCRADAAVYLPGAFDDPVPVWFNNKKHPCGRTRVRPRVTESKQAMTQRVTGSDETSGPAIPAANSPPEPTGVSDIATKRRVSNRRFDAARVARLKAQIEAGRYEIDPFSVADRFIEHERNA